MYKLIRNSVMALAAVAVLGAGVPAVQAAGTDKAVSARKSVMQLRGFYLGTLGGMAKGKVAYDAKKAAGAANSLAALEQLDGSAMWPPGSGNDKLGDKTRALPEIWSTWPAIGKNSKAMKAAVANMANMAGKDLASLQGSIGAVGKACGSCHKAFRAKKK